MPNSHYTIKLCDGKYTVIIDNVHGSLEFLRHGEVWPAADDLRHTNLVRAMVNRIEELEMAIGQVLMGTLDRRGERAGDGMQSYAILGPDGESWRDRLEAVLEQRS